MEFWEDNTSIMRKDSKEREFLFRKECFFSFQTLKWRQLQQMSCGCKCLLMCVLTFFFINGFIDPTDEAEFFLMTWWVVHFQGWRRDILKSLKNHWKSSNLYFKLLNENIFTIKWGGECSVPAAERQIYFTFFTSMFWGRDILTNERPLPGFCPFRLEQIV